MNHASNLLAAAASLTLATSAYAATTNEELVLNQFYHPPTFNPQKTTKADVGSKVEKEVKEALIAKCTQKIPDGEYGVVEPAKAMINGKVQTIEQESVGHIFVVANGQLQPLMMKDVTGTWFRVEPEPNMLKPLRQGSCTVLMHYDPN